MKRFKIVVAGVAALAGAQFVAGSAQAANFPCDGSTKCTFDGFTGGFSDVKTAASSKGTDTFQITFDQLGKFSMSLTSPSANLKILSFNFLGQTISPVVNQKFYDFDITKAATYTLTVNTQNTLPVVPANQVKFKGTNAIAYSGAFQFAPVPEPAAWGLMIGGFGMAGGSLRRRRSARVAIA